MAILYTHYGYTLTMAIHLLWRHLLWRHLLWQELRELKRVLAEALRRSWREPSREESEASTR